MNPTEYRARANATRNRNDTAIIELEGFKRGSNNTRRLLEGSIGAMSEFAELIGEVKSYLFHGVPLDRQMVKAEAGDVLWYLDELLEACGLTIEEVLEANINKLQAKQASWQGRV